MASLQSPEALAYLHDAAHLLRSLAPETSAHLMSVRNRLSSHQGVAMADVQRQQVCAICGHIIVPGLGSIVQLQGRRSRTRPRGRDKEQQSVSVSSGPMKTVTCGLCNRKTSTSVGAPGPAPGRGAHKVKKEKKPDQAQTPKMTVNASSKKRAKNRKAGLQALLSGQQQTASPLSLADFMKK
ncbi:hypothetical protein S7711_05077 [Stachybotrys chartarum IBT 7711]|uniref:Uncharacterized protein n=1 Tax=Stachybotrys chartarum (strain CBS 109288 / IBT 7711) TaxID=1280523 RepID=A0A084ANS8_STACB|nr:hypothetical protein S7711_05077 [Stachybotrys chartarum IBT 7711]KFA47420.1 hypothetical protein S40293_05354 [Stachybotrys chartarum IBT 40293]KFA74659.1 hypothetical protein S40288_03186 [Stachybotrys chartarum IBT 40288]